MKHPEPTAKLGNLQGGPGKVGTANSCPHMGSVHGVHVHMMPIAMAGTSTPQLSEDFALIKEVHGNLAYNYDIP